MAADRGNVVESLYRTYLKQLSSYFQSLHESIEQNAPDILSELEPRPAAVAYGYQILPELKDDPPHTNDIPAPAASEVSRFFSWPITEKFIDSELEKIKAAESKLNASDPPPPYLELARQYRSLLENQKRIDEHLQYNRFWQKAIADDRPRFDRQTKLYEAAVELRSATGERAVELRRMIQQGRPRPSLPAFAVVRHDGPSRTVIELPVYTDISDPSFLDGVKHAVERAWHVSGEPEFQVEVIFRLRSAEDLYPNGVPPVRGEHINVQQHIGRFPKDGAVLTTGANSTHAYAGRSIASGPEPRTLNEMAHEFGHLLGFVDGYFRGYRDLGPDGFEIFETVPDPADIMCAPGEGRVMRSHFEALLAR